MKKESYIEMKENIARLMAEGLLNEKVVFCFGLCEATEEMIQLLNEKGVTVQAILDNNPYKQGMNWNNVPVIFPNQLSEPELEDSVVLIASRAYESMKKQLASIKYKGIIYKIVDYNSFSAYSLEEKILQEKMERVKRGKMLLDQLISPDVECYLLCPNNALGDVCMAFEYFPTYCKRERIRDYEVIVVGEGCAKVAGMYTSRAIHVFNQKETDEILQAVIFYEMKKVFVAHHDRPYINDMTVFIDSAHLSFRDLYCVGVFGLEKGSHAFPPKYCKECSDKSIFDKGNSVILAPYAKSVVKIRESFWTNIAEQHLSKGKKVFTNVSDDELPITGTNPINIPLDEMIDAVQYAGFFVGIRSGLCDVINYSNCDKTVVFPDAYYSVTKTKVCDFFELPGWNKIIV